jgi:probable HAF family extracellular repeat protein
MVFPPTAPWWSAGLKTPQGRGVPFAGRRRVGCKTSARWAARYSEAYGVSADGAVVVGWAKRRRAYRAFRWTASGGMQDLGTLGGYWSEAYGVSADGSVVVGWAFNAAGHDRAFRWTASGGMQDLGTLGGYCQRGLWCFRRRLRGGRLGLQRRIQDRAFRWTASGGMQNLGTLGGIESAAYGVSADGSVVVGWAYNAAGWGVPFAGRRRAAWKT